jgi:hypothetical protein
MFQWIALIAAIVSIVAFAGSIVSSQQPIEPTQQQAAEKHQEDQHNQKGDKALLDRWFPDSISVYTLFLALVTALLALAAPVQLNLLRRAEGIATTTAEAAKNSADVAKDTLIVTNRAWISVNIGIGSDLTYDAQGDARVVIKFVMKNVGNSPAVNVQVDPEFAVVFGDAQPFQKEISDRQKRRPAGLGNLGVTLFPGETQTHSRNLPISRASIDAFNQKRSTDLGLKNVGTVFMPTLVGCIDYKFTFAEEHHQTGFILDLRKRDPENPNTALAFDVQEGVIPAARLWLTQGFIGVPPD